MGEEDQGELAPLSRLRMGKPLTIEFESLGYLGSGWRVLGKVRIDLFSPLSRWNLQLLMQFPNLGGLGRPLCLWGPLRSRATQDLVPNRWREVRKEGGGSGDRASRRGPCISVHKGK